MLSWSCMSTPAPNNPGAFYILDFDRTLADTDKLLEVFIQTVNHYVDLPVSKVKAADASLRSVGDSFDTAGYVKDYLYTHNRPEAWTQLERQFVHESRSLNMLYPGAAELLDRLEEAGLRYGILTYGNPLWQHLKLAAAGFDHIPRIVILTKQKSSIITSWQQRDKTFVLPQEFGGGHASEIVLIDDKAVSFDGFPAISARGYWVLDPVHEQSSQRGVVPLNVKRLNALSEILPLL